MLEEVTLERALRHGRRARFVEHALTRPRRGAARLRRARPVRGRGRARDEGRLEGRARARGRLRGARRGRGARRDARALGRARARRGRRRRVLVAARDLGARHLRRRRRGRVRLAAPRRARARGAPRGGDRARPHGGAEHARAATSSTTRCPTSGPTSSDWATIEYVGVGRGDDVGQRGSLDDGDFTVFYLDGERVVAAATVGRPGDLDHARRMIGRAPRPAATRWPTSRRPGPRSALLSSVGTG